MLAPQDESFAEVLRRAKAGDETAKEELFARLNDMGEGTSELLKLARCVLRRGDRARQFVETVDLMQTAMRAGWLDLSGFRGNTEKEFLAWILTILRNKLQRVVRRRRPHVGLGEGAEERDVKSPATAEAPVENLIRDEMRGRLLSAIRQLPDDQRTVLDLRLQGLQAPEIAEQLGIKSATVRKRESRAVARLRELLG